jgi:hypothetical protein
MCIAFATTDGNPSPHPNCAAPTNAPSAPEAEQPVIFFDGICGLCNRTVDFVIARDHSRLFRFAPLQGETAQRLLNITTSR